MIPDAVATDYASRWLTTVHVYPGHRESSPCPDPDGVASHLTVAFTAQAEREATLVKEVQLSTQVAIATATVTRRMPRR